MASDQAATQARSASSSASASNKSRATSSLPLLDRTNKSPKVVSTKAANDVTHSNWKRNLNMLWRRTGWRSNQLTTPQSNKSASTKEMFQFALPALGIYLAGPLLRNIDNAFVGLTKGTQQLAALSPGTVCTDQMLYLFSFLARATTGMVSRAYGIHKDADAARKAVSVSMTVSLLCGIMISLFYIVGTPSMLRALNVQPVLHKSVSSYIHWRGAVAWASLVQACALASLLSTGDVWTPLKIVVLSFVANVVAGTGLCIWPLQKGCTGAAIATSMSTLLSCYGMLRALKSKHILPDRLALPTKQEMHNLAQYTGPLMVITIIRLGALIAMQQTAMGLGVTNMAAYQLSVNLVIFFLLFGEPLSQISQTRLPALIDSRNGQAVRETLQGVLRLGSITAILMGSIAAVILYLTAGFVTADVEVRKLALEASPAVFLSVAIAIIGVTVDGTMLASRQFGFLMVQGSLTAGMQLFLLRNWATKRSISAVYYTFTLEMGSRAVLALLWTYAGRGSLGKVLYSYPKEDNDLTQVQKRRSG